MSRSWIVASLITAFSSLASADRIEAPHFAQPPGAMPPGAMPHEDMLEETGYFDRSVVRRQLVANRAANLARFQAYQKAGVFPSNTYQDGRLNVWRDKDGHLCAAATIINMSGETDLVRRVAEQTNFLRLADVKQGPVMDWILTSGFTQDEIAAIQEPFMPVTREPAPVDPRIVDRKMRTREDERLRARYRVVEAQILKNQKASIEAATDRLIKTGRAKQLLGVPDAS
jgi:hypothetical protein